MGDKDLQWVRYLLIDLDGVVYQGDTPLPGAREFFAFLAKRGLGFSLVTNNSSRTAAQYVEKLARMDIQVTEAAIFTAGMGTARYLAQVAPRGARLYVIGEEGLIRPLQEAGFVVTDQDPQYVVVGFDTYFTYEKLKTACLSIDRGATFIASNPDVNIPTEEGRLPGGGALSAAISACTGVIPKVVGKPEKELLQQAMAALGAAKDQTVLVGDRLETDVLGARRAGIAAVLVLTGVTQAAELATSPIQPDYVFADLLELRRALEGADA